MCHKKYISSEEKWSNLNETPPLFIGIQYNFFHINDANTEIQNLSGGIFHDRVSNRLLQSLSLQRQTEKCEPDKCTGR